MNLFSLFKRRGSAPVARDRLQILLAYERSTRGPSDLLVILREEILAVVGRHVEIDPNRVSVQMDRGDKVSILEVDIEIPNTVRVTSSGSRRKLVTLPYIAQHRDLALAALIPPLRLQLSQKTISRARGWRGAA